MPRVSKYTEKRKGAGLPLVSNFPDPCRKVCVSQITPKDPSGGILDATPAYSVALVKTRWTVETTPGPDGGQS